MINEKYTLEDIKNDLKSAGVNPSEWTKKQLEQMRDKVNKEE